MIKRDCYIHPTWSLQALLLAMALLCACNGNVSKTPAARHVEPRNQDAVYDGIDISSYQGYIDWEKVSSDKNIRFVYIKATEGATYRSPHYAHNITQARRHGMLVGSYHYLTSTSTIDEQFENFSKFALKQVQDLIPMLDIETRGDWSRSQLQDSVEKFCTLAEKVYGVQPMIYSTMGFYNKNIGLSPFGRYFLGGDGLQAYAFDGREIVPSRGYDNNKLSPKEGASIFARYTLELRQPIIESSNTTIWVRGFLEGGNSWYNAKDFQPFNMYNAAGFGVTLVMPALGMFGLDWGYGFDGGNIGGSHFHCSIGQSLD